MLQHKRSLWQGALWAPLAVPLGFPVCVIIHDHLWGPGEISPNFFAELLMLFALFGLPFTYAVTLILVMPMAVWLRAKNALSSVRLCAFCALLGPITFVGYIGILKGELRLPKEFWQVMSMLAAFGLISGIIFCLAAGIRLWAGQEAVLPPSA